MDIEVKKNEGGINKSRYAPDGQISMNIYGNGSV